MEYKTVLTTAGLADIAAAVQAGGKVAVTHLAMGDGGGAEYAPDSAQSGLKNECWRGAISSYTQQDNRFSVTARMPAETDAFVIRELALFLADGICFAVANAPSIPHQPPVGGVGTEFEAVIPFVVENADSVTVTVDPAGVVPWSAVGVPNGVAPLDESGKVPEVHLPDMAFLPLSGGTMTGDINMGSKKLTNLAAPSSANDAARKADVDAVKTILTSLSVTGSFSVNRTAAYDAHTINLGFRPRMVVIYAGINTDAASIPVITMDAGMNTGIRIITDAYSGQFGKLTSTGFQATFYAQNNYNDTMTVYYIAFR